MAMGFVHMTRSHMKYIRSYILSRCSPIWILSFILQILRCVSLNIIPILSFALTFVPIFVRYRHFLTIALLRKITILRNTPR